MEEGGYSLCYFLKAVERFDFVSTCRGTGTLLLRTVHLLHTLKLRYHDMRLLVPGILGKLLNEHMTQEECTVLCAEAHVISWNYDDAPVTDGKEASGSKSICSDGRFVYSMSSSLKHLMKLGTGKNGSIRYVGCLEVPLSRSDHTLL